MKSELKTIEPQVEVKPFPKLMKSVNSDSVILFFENKKGVVINYNERHNFGDYSERWDMTRFKDLPNNQQVILQNT
jgi:hypothetical protein